jgi:hypothetical protein
MGCAVRNSVGGAHGLFVGGSWAYNLAAVHGKGDFMKLAKLMVTAALVAVSSQAMAASVCSLSKYTYECDGKLLAKGTTKEINTTSVLKDLVEQGYKIVAVTTGGKLTDLNYTLVKE